MQLENMLNPPLFDSQEEMFPPISEDDLYRAGLAKNIVLSEAYDTHETGPYFTYTECAYFDWTFILPLAGVSSVLSTLYIVGEIKTRSEARLTVPFNLKTWFDEMMRPMKKLERGRLIQELL